MTLRPGSRLGPYEIVALLGAGGMGEVYRARDTRLDREVAVKVLPEGFAADAPARERFDREARAIASLNHPHICTTWAATARPTFSSWSCSRAGRWPSGWRRPLPLATALAIAREMRRE